MQLDFAYRGVDMRQPDTCRLGLVRRPTSCGVHRESPRTPLARPAKAFTLIELLIVVTIIVIIAAVGIPSLLKSRAAANESATIGSLRTIATFEAVFRQQAEVDQNSNGLGEYGLLGELSSEIALRPSTNRLAQPIYVSQQFRTGGSASTGTAMKSGFMYKIFLSNAAPGDEDAAGSDKELGGTPATGGPAADPTAIMRQEHNFALYAWPAEYRRSGSRCLFVNESAETYFSKMDAATYDNIGAMPAANAAYCTGAPPFRGRIASGATKGNDNNSWFPAGG